MTNLTEVSEFLDILGKKNFINDNTVQARRVACNNFFDILDNDQKTVEYIQENIDVIKTRFANRFKEVRGNTVDEYARRVMLVINDFVAWKADRGAWEREISARQAGRASNGTGERRSRPEKVKQSASPPPPPAEERNTDDRRVITVPLASGAEVEVKIPRDLSKSDLKRVLWALLPYAKDFDPEVSPLATFPQLGSHDDPLRQ
jgi:hypothetical protein